jgi:hypothetical protein
VVYELEPYVGHHPLAERRREVGAGRSGRSAGAA